MDLLQRTAVVRQKIRTWWLQWQFHAFLDKTAGMALLSLFLTDPFCFLSWVTSFGHWSVSHVPYPLTFVAEGQTECCSQRGRLFFRLGGQNQGFCQGDLSGSADPRFLSGSPTTVGMNSVRGWWECFGTKNRVLKGLFTPRLVFCVAQIKTILEHWPKGVDQRSTHAHRSKPWCENGILQSFVSLLFLQCEEDEEYLIEQAPTRVRIPGICGDLVWWLLSQLALEIGDAQNAVAKHCGNTCNDLPLWQAFFLHNFRCKFHFHFVCIPQAAFVMSVLWQWQCPLAVLVHDLLWPKNGQD